MDIVGYDYVQQRSFDAIEGAAKNPGSQNGFMGAGIGLGMGVGLGSAFGDQMSDIASTINLNGTEKCAKCGMARPKGSKFCPHCGNSSANTETQKIKCSSCGALYDRTVKFCPECGNAYKACPVCGADVPDNEIQCPDCKSELSSVCPACKTKLNPSNKFCPNCGEKI